MAWKLASYTKLYIRNNKEIPKFSESLVIDESAIVNKLKNHL